MSEAPASPGPKARVRGFVEALAFLAVWGAATTTVAAFFASAGWAFDLATHFPWQYAIVAGAGLVVSAWLRWRVTSAAAALTVVVNVALVLPVFVSGGPSPATPGIVVGVMNLNASNRDAEAVLAELRAAAPDVVALLEYAPAWDSALVELDAYPHRIRYPRPSPFGIALYGRMPLERVRVAPLVDGGGAASHAEIALDGRRAGLLALHPYPPFLARGTEFRDRELAAAHRFLADSVAHPTIVLGDLNATRWSHGFRLLRGDLGLRSAADGFGILRTFPTGAPFLGIGIDHVVLPGELAARSVERGGDVGSEPDRTCPYTRPWSHR